MLYTTKSKEELEEVLFHFFKGYEAQFGQELNHMELKTMVDELIEKKKRDRFKSVFETHTPESLQLISQICISMAGPKPIETSARNVIDETPHDSNKTQSDRNVKRPPQKRKKSSEL